jgi:hypothetical protein
MDLEATYTCPICGTVSHNANDAAQRFCGRCHTFADDGEPAELAALRELVAAQDWRFARTIPQWPHTYMVRSPDNEALFARLFQAIRTYGRDDKFGPFRNRYLHLGDGWKYWSMDRELKDTTTVINRDQQLDPTTFQRAAAPGGGRHPGHWRKPAPRQ